MVATVALLSRHLDPVVLLVETRPMGTVHHHHRA